MDADASNMLQRWAELCKETFISFENSNAQLEVRLKVRESLATKHSRKGLRNETPEFELVSEVDDGESTVVSVLTAGVICHSSVSEENYKGDNNGIAPSAACISLVRLGLLRLRVVAATSGTPASGPPSLFAAALWAGPVENEIATEELDSDSLAFRFARRCSTIAARRRRTPWTKGFDKPSADARDCTRPSSARAQAGSTAAP